MIPPVEIRDRSEYKARMNELLKLDRERTVILTIDMQREFLDLEIAGEPLAEDDAERVLARSKELLDFARAEGIPVIHVYVSRRPIEAERGAGTAPMRRVSKLAGLSQNAQAPVKRLKDRLEGAPETEVPAILVGPEDIHVTTKKSYDGFLYTDLEFLLQRVFKADTVVLTGINTDSCVYSTTFSASTRGYKPVVISDCVASTRGKDHHWMALELMSRSFAWVLTVEQFKEKVRGA